MPEESIREDNVGGNSFVQLLVERGVLKQPPRTGCPLFMFVLPWLLGVQHRFLGNLLLGGPLFWVLCD